MIRKLWQLFFTKEFLKFLGVGVINTLIGYSLIFLFLNIIKLDYWISTFLGNSIGAIVSYVLNKKFTFNSKAAIPSSMLRFIAVISICYLVAYGLSYLISNMLPLITKQTISVLIIENIAVIVGMGFYTILNFLGQKYFVFREIASRQNAKSNSK